jgi:hypothetical protein
MMSLPFCFLFHHFYEVLTVGNYYTYALSPVNPVQGDKQTASSVAAWPQ